jgi:hypothetical protein
MSSSPRVRLEVEFLDAEAAPAPLAPSAPDDERIRRTVLVVSGETDFRGYVRECLRERTDLRVLEAATVAAAVATSAQFSPMLLIVDEPERAVVAMLSQVPAIVIVDDVPRGERTPGPQLLARPFTAEGLLAEVDQLLT